MRACVPATSHDHWPGLCALVTPPPIYTNTEGPPYLNRPTHQPARKKPQIRHGALPEHGGTTKIPPGDAQTPEGCYYSAPNRDRFITDLAEEKVETSMVRTIRNVRERYVTVSDRYINTNSVEPIDLLIGGLNCLWSLRT